MSVFRAGDGMPTAHHHVVHYLRVFTESLPAKCNLVHFRTPLALRKAAVVRVTVRGFCLIYWHHLPALSPDKASGRSDSEKRIPFKRS